MVRIKMKSLIKKLQKNEELSFDEALSLYELDLSVLGNMLKKLDLKNLEKRHILISTDT